MPLAGAGTTVLSGAFCSGEGNDDEINSNSHCQRLHPTLPPLKYGYVLFLWISSVHDTFILWVF